MAADKREQQRQLVTPAGRKPGHWEERTVNRRGAKAPFHQRFYVTEKEQPHRRKKQQAPDQTRKLHSLYRRLGRLLREPDLPQSVEDKARKLRQRIMSILVEHRKTALSEIQQAVRAVTGRPSSGSKRPERPERPRADKSECIFIYLL